MLTGIGSLLYTICFYRVKDFLFIYHYSVFARQSVTGSKDAPCPAKTGICGYCFKLTGGRGSALVSLCLEFEVLAAQVLAEGLPEKRSDDEDGDHVDEHVCAVIKC